MFVEHTREQPDQVQCLNEVTAISIYSKGTVTTEICGHLESLVSWMGKLVTVTSDMSTIEQSRSPGHPGAVNIEPGIVNLQMTGY